MRNYIKFCSNSMKARIAWTQEVLISTGHLKDGESVPTKRDKAFIKALKAFQVEHGMTPNADFSEELFNYLKAEKR